MAAWPDGSCEHGTRRPRSTGKACIEERRCLPLVDLIHGLSLHLKRMSRKMQVNETE